MRSFLSELGLAFLFAVAGLAYGGRECLARDIRPSYWGSLACRDLSGLYAGLTGALGWALFYLILSRLFIQLVLAFVPRRFGWKSSRASRAWLTAALLILCDLPNELNIQHYNVEARKHNAAKAEEMRIEQEQIRKEAEGIPAVLATFGQEMPVRDRFAVCQTKFSNHVAFQCISAVFAHLSSAVDCRSITNQHWRSLCAIEALKHHPRDKKVENVCKLAEIDEARAYDRCMRAKIPGTESSLKDLRPWE